MGADVIRLCSVDGCEKSAVQRGLMCAMHRSRLRNHGTTEFVRPPGRPAEPMIDRFLRRVEFSESTYDGTRCLEWTGALTASGYGRFGTTSRGRGLKGVQAHRWLYERWVGPIPDGLVLDHLCHDPRECQAGNDCPHRRCVNPLHLAPTTIQANTARSANVVKDCCVHGHPYTPENTYTHPTTGARACRECRRIDSHRRYLARKADAS